MAHPQGYLAAENAEKNIPTKLYLNSPEFWILLPSKGSVARTKVNIHQFAKYTDELFTRTELLETNVLQQNSVISELSELLEKKSAQIESLTSVLNTILTKFKDQYSAIDSLNLRLGDLTDHVIATIPPKHYNVNDNYVSSPIDEFSDSDSDSGSDSGCNYCNRQLEIVKNPEITEEVKTKTAYYEDECFFFAPLKKNKSEEKEHYPAPSIVMPSKIESTTAIRSISPENSIRAHNSFSFCGNE